jgi:UDP:flavonoid glycosyltransferase YjiC (YdhE family)
MVGSPKLTAKSIAAGIKEVTTEKTIAAAAEVIGKKVRAEDGLANATRFIDKMTASFKFPWPTT